MATLAATAARRAATLARSPAPSSAAHSSPWSCRRRRSLLKLEKLKDLKKFSFADHHGPQKVNFWQDPTSPSKWKEEHFVIISLTGWGLLFFSGYKFFTGGRKEENTVKTTQ